MTTENKKEIEQLCTDIKGLKNFLAEIEEEINGKENRIKDIMKKENEYNIRTNTYHIIWEVVLTNYFDKKKCAEKYAEIIEQFTTKKESRPFKMV